MKKVLSVVLALALVLTLAVPSFAANITDSAKAAEGITQAITGTTNVPTIAVTVPTTGTIVLNPYKLSYDDSADQDGSGSNTDQVISATQYIVNGSSVPVVVSASVKATPAGNAKLATKTLVGDTKTLTNSAYLYFEAKTADDNTTAVTDWSGATQQVLGTAAKKIALPTMAADVDGSTPTYLAYHIAGDAVANPTTAWTTADKYDVEIVFTVVAQAASSATSGS